MKKKLIYKNAKYMQINRQKESSNPGNPDSDRRTSIKMPNICR
jgi:hypothetical protein